MRSSELLKEIKTKPEVYIPYLKAFKKTEPCNEMINGYLVEHKVRKGQDYYWVRYNGKLIEQGVNK